MKYNSIKYIFAYISPLTAIGGFLLGGYWVFAVVVLDFVLVPLGEWLLPINQNNVNREEEDEHVHSKFYDFLLYMNIPMVFITLFLFLNYIQEYASVLQLIGACLAMGIVLGTCAINIAHELGHREDKWNQQLAKFLLLPALYQHFFIEHNRGHHKYVGTPHDPSSAKKNQSLYRFWLQTVPGTHKSAWNLEKQRLAKNGKPLFSINNQLLRFYFYQSLYLMSILLFFDLFTLVLTVLAAVVGFLLLESVNYIEHYGLERKLQNNGMFEPVNLKHSWNSSHQLGRILLYELTRHSDHHYKSTRKYQILRHHEESPQLPLGYPGSIILALLPRLWFKIMNSRIPS